MRHNTATTSPFLLERCNPTGFRPFSAACAVWLACLPLWAATFVVTTTDDSGPGSLRQAILDSNATSTSNEIDFNIAPGGVQVISPLTALPAITTPVTILGSTQPGFTGTPLIQIDGDHALNASGLSLQIDGCVVQGLSITRFHVSCICGEFGHGIYSAGFGQHLIVGNFIGVDATTGTGAGNQAHGILLAQSDNNVVGGTSPAERNVISDNSHGGGPYAGISIGGNTNIVQGNFIGTDSSGLAPLGNHGAAGVIIWGDYNLIGGAVPGAGNVISANFTNAGIELDPHLVGTHDGPSLGNVIQGNLIGTDVNGLAALPNVQDGIRINAACQTQIGGHTPLERNVISGNHQDGISILSGDASLGVASTNNSIQGNFIGLKTDGTGPLPNGRDGIYIINSLTPTIANYSQIGGTTFPGEANMIAHNGRNGVTIEQGIGYPILGDSIFDNAVLGIDLGADGPTANHPCDTVTGPNNWQNFPVLSSAYSDGSHITISGSLNSVPNRFYRLEFFWNTHCYPINRADGHFIGATSVATGAGCDVAFSGTFNIAVPVGAVLAATATSPSKDTSEFSFCQTVAAPPSVSGSASGDGTIMLSWPTDPGGWILQRTPGLNPPKWQDDPNQVVVLDGMNTVKEPLIPGNMLYRLRSP